MEKFKKVEYKEFELIGVLEDEEMMLEQFYDYSGYVCDIINELADSFIPVYNFDVWKDVVGIQEYIEDAVESGLVDTNNFDLIKTFQAGYYNYYQQSLYNNLDILAYNAVAEKVNEVIVNMDDSEIDKLDIESITSAIEEETKNFDNNNTQDNFDDIADQIIADYLSDVSADAS